VASALAFVSVKASVMLAVALALVSAMLVGLALVSAEQALAVGLAMALR